MRHYQNSVRWATGVARKYNETVGPRHDPYSRDIVEIQKDGHVITLMSCGLAGEWIKLPNGEEIHNAGSMFCSVKDKARHYQNFDAEVIRHTGQNFYFWHHALWDKVERNRHRRDPEGYALFLAAEASISGCI